MVVLNGFCKEFLEFLKENKVIGLGVAFIIGAASTKLVTAIVNDLVITEALVPGWNWRQAVFRVGEVRFLIGISSGHSLTS